jgi:glutamine synthetase
MRQFLTKEAYKNVMDANKSGLKISRVVADHISTGMKEWAISKGATHYTHWFQPLTGATAEKHDAFLKLLVTVLQLRNLEEINWFSRNLMLPVFRMGE